LRAACRTFSPCGGEKRLRFRRIARESHTSNLKWQESWKRYRGGQTNTNLHCPLSDLQLEKVPRENSNDGDPVGWATPSISLRRNGPVTLLCLRHQIQDCEAGSGEQWLRFEVGQAGPDVSCLEQFGGIYLFDPRTSIEPCEYSNRSGFARDSRALG